MKTGYLPVRNSAKTSKVFTDFLAAEDDPFDGNAAKCLNAAYTEINYFYTDIAFTGSSIVRDKVDSMIQTLYCQNKTIDEVMTAAYNEIKTFGIKCE